MDGFHARSKSWHLQKIGFILPLLLVPVFFDTGIGWLLVGYLLTRVGLFDILNNAFRGSPLDYRGHDWWGRFVNKFDPPLVAELFGRVIFLMAGVFMLIQQL